MRSKLDQSESLLGLFWQEFQGRLVFSSTGDVELLGC